MTVGMLVAYQTLLGSFMQPINTLVSFGSELQELQADMNRLDDVLRYPADKQYGRIAPSSKYDPRVVKLSGLGRVEERHLRIQPARTAADPGLQPARRARARASLSSDRAAAASRPSPKVISGLYAAVGRRDSVRRQAAHEIPARPAGRTRSRSSIRKCSCSAARSARTSRCGIRPCRFHGSARLRRDAAIAEVIEAREGGYKSPVQEGRRELQRRPVPAPRDRARAWSASRRS